MGIPTWSFTLPLAASTETSHAYHLFTKLPIWNRGHPKWWWKVRESPPSPKHSGLGMKKDHLPRNMYLIPGSFFLRSNKGVHIENINIYPVIGGAKGPRMMSLPTKWGAFENPRNPQNRRVDMGGLKFSKVQRDVFVGRLSEKKNSNWPSVMSRHLENLTNPFFSYGFTMVSST